MLTDEQINRDLEMWFAECGRADQKEEEESSGLWTFVAYVCVIVTSATFWGLLIALVRVHYASY